MTAPDQPAASCPATTLVGRPCAGTPRPSGWCFTHDPALADARAAGRSRGGTNRATVTRITARMPATVADLTAAVLSALVDVRAGRLTPARGQAIASLARAALAAHQAEDTGRRLDQIEDHLDTVVGGSVVRWPR